MFFFFFLKTRQYVGFRRRIWCAQPDYYTSDGLINETVKTCDGPPQKLGRQSRNPLWAFVHCRWPQQLVKVSKQMIIIITFFFSFFSFLSFFFLFFFVSIHLYTVYTYSVKYILLKERNQLSEISSSINKRFVWVRLINPALTWIVNYYNSVTTK